MTHFSEARLLASAAGPADYPRHERTEVALAGRSNVGKSSLINALVPMRRLARVSKEPGKTRTLNFYALDERLCLVDLPGYGYARVSRTLREAWGPMVEEYLRHRPQLKLILVLVDARHGPTADDLEMWAWAKHAPQEALAVATKWDKVKPSQRVRRLREMEAALGGPPLLFSAVTGEGKEHLIRALLTAAAR